MSTSSGSRFLARQRRFMLCSSTHGLSPRLRVYGLWSLCVVGCACAPPPEVSVMRERRPTSRAIESARRAPSASRLSGPPFDSGSSWSKQRHAVQQRRRGYGYRNDSPGSWASRLSENIRRAVRGQRLTSARRLKRSVGPTRGCLLWWRRQPGARSVNEMPVDDRMHGSNGVVVALAVVAVAEDT
jgi:hypothetical protein